MEGCPEQIKLDMRQTQNGGKARTGRQPEGYCGVVATMPFRRRNIRTI